MHFAFSTAFFFCTSHLAIAAVYPHRTVPVRKPLRLGIRGLPDPSFGYVQPQIEKGGMQEPSNELNNLQIMRDPQPVPHEHSFMMITASSGGSREALGDGQEGEDGMSFEMLVVDFVETDGNQEPARQIPVPTIEAVKTVKRILPPPAFPPTLRSQLITDETRAKADRLKLLADLASSEQTDPFIKLAESLGAAIAAERAEALKATQVTPTEPSAGDNPCLPPIVQKATQVTSTEPSAADNTGLPVVVQKAPQSQRTFNLSEDKSSENYNTSHHSQL